MGLCSVCGRDLISGSVHTLARGLQGTNFILGEILQDVGWEVVDKELWKTTRCCRKCVSILRRWINARMTMLEINANWKERTGGSDLPIPIVNKKRKEVKTDGFKTEAIKHIVSSKYGRLLRTLKRKKTIRDKWVLDIQKTIRQEMKCLERDKTLFSRNASGSHDYRDAEWDEILDKIKIRAPVLFSVLFSAMTNSDKIQKIKRLHRSRLGMMFLIPLHHRKPCYHKIPKYLPLTFAKSLFSRQIPSGFQTHRPVVRKEVNTIVKSWQASIEEGSSAENGTLIAGADMHPGYSLVINSRSSKSQYGDHTVYNAFAVKNRLSFRELQDDTTVKASDLPLKTYLPSQTDYEELRMRMRILVERILKANLDLFPDQSILEHIPHQYSKECSQKSEYVNVEVVDDDDDDDEEGDNNAKRVLKMLNKLSKLVPDGYDTPLHVDQEAMTMIRSARRAEDPTFENHNNQLHPVPQDLRAVIVRDTIADLFTPTQATEKGTLRHLKVFFGHNSVNEEVSSFKHTEDFLLFITCAFVVGFALEIMKKSKPCKPELGPVADEIVRRIWYQLPMNRVADIVNAPVKDHDDQFCFCKEDIGEVDMVECCNIDCPNGRWFHQNCVMYMYVEAEGEWFCSPECEQSNMGHFCICRQKGEVGTDLTWSCANESCQRGERFHHRCVRSTLPVRHDDDDDDWYCSAECAGDEERDQFLDYIHRVTWCSLFSECIRDAEREGDGLASIAYWRISMPELFARGHDQHVAATHQLLAGTSGCFPSRIREEVIHNRTINLQGGTGDNISLDFTTEQLDKAKAVEAPIISQGELNSKSKKKASKPQRFARHHDDVAKFIDNFGDIFCEMKGRIVPSLCHKIVGQEITQKKTSDMKKSLLKLNKNFDKEMMKYHTSPNSYE